MTAGSLVEILRAHLLKNGLGIHRDDGVPLDEPTVLREIVELIVDSHGLTLQPWEVENTREIDPTVGSALRALSAKRHQTVFIPARRPEKEGSRKGKD